MGAATGAHGCCRGRCRGHGSCHARAWLCRKHRAPALSTPLNGRRTIFSPGAGILAPTPPQRDPDAHLAIDTPGAVEAGAIDLAPCGAFLLASAVGTEFEDRAPQCPSSPGTEERSANTGPGGGPRAGAGNSRHSGCRHCPSPGRLSLHSDLPPMTHLKRLRARICTLAVALRLPRAAVIATLQLPLACSSPVPDRPRCIILSNCRLAA
jgi:hypothetical protein